MGFFCHVDSEVFFLVAAVVEAVTCLHWLPAPAAVGPGASHVVQGTAFCRDLPAGAEVEEHNEGEVSSRQDGHRQGCSA